MMLMKKIILIFSLVFSTGVLLQAQSFVWTGNAGDNDFFNENNWKNPINEDIPIAGTIDPGTAIQLNLLIENVSEMIGGEIGIANDILFANGSFTVNNAKIKLQDGKGIQFVSTGGVVSMNNAILKTDFVNNANISLGSDAQLYLRSSNPFNSNTIVNLINIDAWVYVPNINVKDFISFYLSQISINGAVPVDFNNVRFAQYYEGTAITGFDINMTPLSVFDGADLSGDIANVKLDLIYAGSNIPGNMENKISSFILKKGHMVTLAIKPDGKDLSKVFIASESDLVIDELPAALNDAVSFVRVVPWIWVNKKGTGGDISNIDASWYYSWGAKHNSYADREFAPMGWGKGSFDSQSEVNAVLNKKRVTHVMSFNESDHCEGQSGKYGSLCVVDTAVIYHKNTMKLGLRIVSPSNREGKELTWLKSMNNLAVPIGARMDVIGMHWYDWASNPSASPDASPQIVFNRFKNKVLDCYNYYKMPIWITEFNANPSRKRWVQDGFLELALPWLEAQPFVERYAYFQPNGGNGDFFDSEGNITSTGEIYLNHVSTPSIKEEDYNRYVNNLESRLNESYVSEPESNLVKNGFFNDSGSNWSKNNSDIIFEFNAETGINGTTCRMPGAQNERSIEQNINVLSGETYNFSFVGRIQNAVGASDSQPNEHTTNGAATLKGEIILPDFNVLCVLSTQSSADVELTSKFTVPEDISSVTVKLSKNWNIAYLDNVLVSLVDLTTVNKTNHLEMKISSFKDQLFFETSLPIAFLCLFDISGRLIANKNPMATYTSLRIDTPGVYFAKAIFSNGEQSCKKVIVH
jgi:hypothetical protein